jgi:hypothetical protein
MTSSSSSIFSHYEQTIYDEYTSSIQEALSSSPIVETERMKKIYPSFVKMCKKQYPSLCKSIIFLNKYLQPDILSNISDLSNLSESLKQYLSSDKTHFIENHKKLTKNIQQTCILTILRRPVSDEQIQKYTTCCHPDIHNISKIDCHDEIAEDYEQIFYELNIGILPEDLIE